MQNKKPYDSRKFKDLVREKILKVDIQSLSMIIVENNENLFDYILSKDISLLNQGSSDELTPLMLAINNDRQSIMNKIIALAANVNLAGKELVQKIPSDLDSYEKMTVTPLWFALKRVVSREESLAHKEKLKMNRFHFGTRYMKMPNKSYSMLNIPCVYC